MASLARFIEGRLRLKINQDKSAVARPEDRHFLGFRLRLDPQSAGRGGPALGAHQAQRDGQDPAADAETPGAGTLESCIAGSTRGWRGWHQFFGIVAPRGAVDIARARRSYPASAARDRAAPLETQTNDRSQPRQARCQAAERVAAGLCGTQVPVGAEPHARSRSRPDTTVLHRARAASPWSSCTAQDTSTSSPLSRRNWRYGDRSRSITGRRRGSQPAVPKSRVRTAQARFCGSRGGQPPRLPDDQRPDGSVWWSPSISSVSFSAGVRNPSVWRGRSLSLRATSSSSA